MLLSGPPDSRKHCWFAGWGRVLTNPVLYAEQLQDSRLKINQYCGPYSFVLTRNTFCAGFQGLTVLLKCWNFNVIQERLQGALAIQEVLSSALINLEKIFRFTELAAGLPLDVILKIQLVL